MSAVGKTTKWLMPRPHRIIVADVPLHITQRGNYGQRVFFRDEDRRLYLALLGEFLPHYGVSLEGYCLLSNHVHLIATPHNEKGLSRALQRIQSDYSRATHVRLRRVGHLWQARFHSTALDEEHFWAALLYVERNSVRAGLAERAEQWRWSSAAGHCGGRCDVLLDLVRWRARFDASRWQRYLALGAAEGQVEDRIRAATLSGFPLGSEEFRQGIEAQLGRPASPRKAGRPKKGDAPQAFTATSGAQPA
jgi:putative transposase